jgi:16S rRNA (adenine1518-N6/adenine1519-N6)-dimethyltransferase
MPKSHPSSPHVKAKKSLGQNFLQEPTYLEQIVAAAELAPDDLVLEIGPGQGVLTRELVARAAGVVAVELDDRLITPLRAMFATQLDRVRIVHGDILEMDPVALVDQLAGQLSRGEVDAPYKVVANLPYYITSAAIRQLLEARRPPSRAVLLVQLEVAQRICAEPGDMSLLAVSVQYYARPQLIQRVPAGAFRPVPKVDSAILRLDVYPQPAVALAPEPFFAVVRAGFGQKRKQLLNSLSAGLGRPKAEIAAALACAGVDPMRRAETLSLGEWEILCGCLAA